MAEGREGPSIRPDKDRGLDIKRFIPGSAERVERQRDSKEIFTKALDLVQNYNPQPINWSDTPEHHRGLRVDFSDIGGEHLSQAHILWEPLGEVEPTRDEPTQLDLMIKSRRYRITNNNDDFDVRAESGFSWDKDGREEEGLITKTRELTPKGRAEVLKVLDELPHAKRRKYEKATDIDDQGDL